MDDRLMDSRPSPARGHWVVGERLTFQLARGSGPSGINRRGFGIPAPSPTLERGASLGPRPAQALSGLLVFGLIWSMASGLFLKKVMIRI